MKIETVRFQPEDILTSDNTKLIIKFTQRDEIKSLRFVIIRTGVKNPSLMHSAGIKQENIKQGKINTIVNTEDWDEGLYELAEIKVHFKKGNQQIFNSGNHFKRCVLRISSNKNKNIDPIAELESKEQEIEK